MMTSPFVLGVMAQSPATVATSMIRPSPWSSDSSIVHGGQGTGAARSSPGRVLRGPATGIDRGVHWIGPSFGSS